MSRTKSLTFIRTLLLVTIIVFLTFSSLAPIVAFADADGGTGTGGSADSNSNTQNDTYGGSDASYGTSGGSPECEPGQELVTSVAGGNIIDTESWTAVIVYECVTVSYPDLTAGAVTTHGELLASSTVYFSGIVTNEGTVNTNAAFNTIFFIDRGNNRPADNYWDLSLAGESVASLSVNASTTVSSVDWNNIPFGTHAVMLCADFPPWPAGNNPESNEVNNCGPWTTFTVIREFVDLTASAPTVQGTLIEGNTLAFSGTVNNFGTKEATGFNSFFQIDTGSNGWDDWRGDHDELKSLGLGAESTSGTITSQYWENAPIGTHQVRLCADFKEPWSGNLVTESDEDNNCGAATTFIVQQRTGPYFDLKVNGSDSPPAVESGKPFYFTWASQDVGKCVPQMVNSTDSWWTDGPDEAMEGDYLKTSFGNASNYRNTGLAHSRTEGGTYTYKARCERITAGSAPSWLMHLVELSVPFADAETYEDSVPVTVTVCDAGEVVRNGVCVPVTNKCDRLYPYCVGDTLHEPYYTDGSYPACTVSETTTECAIRCDASKGACVSTADTNALLEVSPSLVRNGYTTNVIWHATSTKSCKLTGTNGDLICDDADPYDRCRPGGERNLTQASSPLSMQTTYTLRCTVEGASDIVKTKTVNIVPTFQER